MPTVIQETINFKLRLFYFVESLGHGLLQKKKTIYLSNLSVVSFWLSLAINYQIKHNRNWPYRVLLICSMPVVKSYTVTQW